MYQDILLSVLADGHLGMTYLLKRGTVCESATRCEPQSPVEIGVRSLETLKLH